jgi:ABC-type Fe3+-hydroxamate transport system substrate-binding protein
VAGAPLPRVVALAPSAAEIVYALGAAERVVGVSDFAADLPESRGCGSAVSPDLERIAALHPISRSSPGTAPTGVPWIASFRSGCASW